MVLYSLFKVGDLVSNPHYTTQMKQKLVVEAVYSGGQMPYYLCSWVEEGWPPIMQSHAMLTRWAD